MSLPLMPKATAVWLVENTALTFEQIADLCGMHPLEVQGIADGEVAVGIVGIDPVANGQISADDIKRCEADKKARLKLLETTLPQPVARSKGARYTPVSKRQDRPAAIAWLLRHHGELTDAQVGRLVGTTKATIQKVRDRSHWDISNIKPTNPVTLGLCSQDQLDEAIGKAHRISERAKKEAERAARRATKALATAQAAKAADAARDAAKTAEDAAPDAETPPGEPQTTE
ncbi:MAG: DUF1013 domain-containing protein [Rhodospirillales bacterium]|nr:DUF1013 domain-containing protein [Rhodospirillales bacterium]